MIFADWIFWLTLSNPALLAKLPNGLQATTVPYLRSDIAIITCEIRF